MILIEATTEVKGLKFRTIDFSFVSPFRVNVGDFVNVSSIIDPNNFTQDEFEIIDEHLHKVGEVWIGCKNGFVYQRIFLNADW